MSASRPGGHYDPPLGAAHRQPRLGHQPPLPQPFIPEGEPYTLRPWADGSSPAKITEGRAGADVR